LNGHLDIGRLPSDDHQPLPVTTPRAPGRTDPHSPRLHDFDGARAHVPDFVDLASAFPDDATDEIVRNVDLLRLQLLWRLLGVVLWRRGRRRIVAGITGNVRGPAVLRPSRVARRSVARVRIRRHAFVSLDENVAYVVRSDVDRVSDAGNAQDPLFKTRASGQGVTKRERERDTSVEPGNMPSLAFSLAPLASCISLILDPCLPMTEPMRELGIINLIVTARLPGTEGTSKGSSLIRRTIKPNA
jgi:hypothetical protein